MRSGWRAAAYLGAFVLLGQLLVGGALGVALALFLLLTRKRLEPEELQAMLERYELGLIAALVTLPLLLAMSWLFMRFLDRRTFRSLGFWWDRKAVTDLLVGLAMGAGLVVLICAACLFGGWCAFAGRSGATSGSGLVPMLLFTFVGLAAAALNEEIVFRGYVQRNLEEGLGAVHSIAVASILFALVHALNPNVTLAAMVNLFLAGVLLGLVYLRFRSIWAVWAMHFAWNFTMGPVLGVPVSGLRTASLFRVELADPAVLDSPDWWVMTGGPFGFEGGLASTLVMVLVTGLLLLWRGRAPRPPEPHPAHLARTAKLSAEAVAPPRRRR
jgi:membrane protease YdiL (CAAX protease family)